MSTKQALARVERESTRLALAQRALAARAAPLARLTRQVNPVVLTGSAVLVGLVAGRLLGRPSLPRALEPAALLAGALQKSLAGLLETLFAAALRPAPGPARPSGDSTAGTPRGTRSRSP